MNGTYALLAMHTVRGVAVGVLGLAKVAVELSKTARLRLKWFEFCYDHGGNVSLTCRHLGISRQTFYCWRGALQPAQPEECGGQQQTAQAERRFA